MNEIIHESSSTLLQIKMPSFQGLGSFLVEHKHELRKPFPHLLKIKLTPTLHIVEFNGTSRFKITEAICNYRINVVDKLIAADLAKIWHASAKHLIDAFNKFELNKFGMKSDINFSSPLELEPIVQQHVDWFYGIS